MEKKYEITDRTRRVNGTDVYKIRALKTFEVPCFSAPVTVHAGDCGGYIESEKNLSQGGSCWVFGNAVVMDDAIVTDDAHASDNVTVQDAAKVCGEAIVQDNAVIKGNAVVKDKAYVTDYAVIKDNATVKDHGFVKDYAIAKDTAVIEENGEVSERAVIKDNSIVEGKAFGGTPEYKRYTIQKRHNTHMGNEYYVIYSPDTNGWNLTATLDEAIDLITMWEKQDAEKAGRRKKRKGGAK